MTTERSTSVTRRTSAPPAAVWAVLTDIDRAPEVLQGVDRVDRLAGTGYEVGTRWRETRTMMGRSASEEMQVTAVELGRRTVVEATSSGVHYTTVFELSPAGTGTEITMRFGGTPVNAGRGQKLLWRLVGGLGLRATARTMRTDLADITRAAEAG